MAFRDGFSRLQNVFFVLNLEKCEFSKGVISYLGKTAGEGQVKPFDNKVQTIPLLLLYKCFSHCVTLH